MKKLKPVSITLLLIIPLIFLVQTQIQAQNIFNAVLNGDLTKVKELIEKEPKLLKVKVIGSGWYSATPLHLAAQCDNVEIVRYLIEKGADINAPRDDFMTPLMMAGINVSKVLVETGVDINYKTPEGRTAISYAAETGDRQVFNYLLDQGANLPEHGTYGAIRSIEIGLRGGNVKCLDYYLKEGLDIRFENKAKMTLAHFASESNSPELLIRLKNLKAPLNNRDLYGWTPLHTAAFNGNLQIVKLLIEAGLDKDARTIDGKTPYLLAIEEKKTDVAEYLVSVSADQGEQKVPVLKGKYFGIRKPGKVPEPFVAPIPEVQKGLHSTFSFSPDGTEVYWKPVWNPNTAIWTSKMKKGKWTTPGIAPFSKEVQGDDAPFISPDGTKLFFLSQRPVTGNELVFPYVEKIWMMDKTEDGWSEPRKLSDSVNDTKWMHWQLSVDNKNNLYFSAGGSIYCSHFNNGIYSKSEKLGNVINTSPVNFSPCISPDGSYLIFTKQVPVYTYQLYLSFREKDGTWTEAINLSDYLKYEYALNPRITPDGKYFFFTGLWGVTYWVDAGIIEELRSKK